MPEKKNSEKRTPSGWAIGGGILLFIIVVSSFSGGDGEETYSAEDGAYSSGQTVTTEDTSSETTIPNSDEINRAALHVGRVAGALSTEGSSFYSRRCYESLERQFTLRGLDRCYAFDFLARGMSQEDALLDQHFSRSNIEDRWRIAIASSEFLANDLETRRMAIESAAKNLTVKLVMPPKPVFRETDGSDDTDEPDGADPFPSGIGSGFHPQESPNGNEFVPEFDEEIQPPADVGLNG